MTEHCSFCGRINPPYEKHHIAGFINHPFWTVRACIECHIILSAWQWTRRTPLNKELEPPDEIKLQAILEGLSTAYNLACEYAGYTPATIAAGSIITKILKHDPDPMTGKVFSLDGSYPKLKARHPLRSAANLGMCGENFQRVIAAMCGIIAYLVEEKRGESDSLAILLRKLERMEPKTFVMNIAKADLLTALSTCDEEIIRDKLSKISAEMGIVL
jgi:hypothetical protein